MLWVFLSIVAFVALGIIFFGAQRILKGTVVLGINGRKKVIVYLSNICFALACIALSVEACVTVSQVDNANSIMNDPCPSLDGLRTKVFQKVNEGGTMLAVMLVRLTNFTMAWIMVCLQIFDKQNQNMPVGRALWVSCFSSYVMLGGTSVELYYVAACSLSLKMVVHSVLSVLSTIGSMLSIHLDLVGEVDRTKEIEIDTLKTDVKEKDDKIKELNTLIDVLDSIQVAKDNKIHSLKTKNGEHNSMARDYESKLRAKDEKIEEVASQVVMKDNLMIEFWASEKKMEDEINTLKSQVKRKDEQITQLNSQMDMKDYQITQLNSQMDMKDYQITELNSQVVMKDNMIAQLNSQVALKDTLIAQLNYQVAMKDTLITELQVVVKDNLITRDKSQVDTKEITRLKSLVDTKDEEIHRLETKNGELKSMVSASEREQLAKDEKIEELSGEAILMRVNLELNDDEEQLPAESGL